MREKPSLRPEETGQPFHGGNIFQTARLLGRSPTELIDMSSNLSPLGPPDGLVSFLADRLGEIAYLPEPASETLRDFFAERYGLEPGQVLVGNGTTEFIHALPKLISPRCALFINPTYSGYQRACLSAQVVPVHINLEEKNDFYFDLEPLHRLLKGGELVFLCNPNSPTGMLTPTQDIFRLVEQNSSSFFVVDESYLPFCEAQSLMQWPWPKNLFVLQSYSKIFTIPGLRLGFLVGPAAKMKSLHAGRGPWEVNRLAQLAGEFLVEHGEEHAGRVRAYLERVRDKFVTRLSEIPHLKVFKGKTHFLLCKLTGSINANMLSERLLAQGIMIRNCASIFSLDDHYFRISLRGEADNEKSLRAIAAILD